MSHYDLELGKIAYEGYCKKTGWKSLATGQSLPAWENLTSTIKDAWIESAKAVRDRVRMEP